MVPILKKPNADSTEPNNYRPITISVTLSKLLEIYILEESGVHEFHDLQFGCIENRGTCMASALAHDVIQYCVKRGSTVFTCALDAEGAFDTIPHDILFYKSINILQDQCWRLIVS